MTLMGGKETGAKRSIIHDVSIHVCFSIIESILSVMLRLNE